MVRQALLLVALHGHKRTPALSQRNRVRCVLSLGVLHGHELTRSHQDRETEPVFGSAAQGMRLNELRSGSSV